MKLYSVFFSLLMLCLFSCSEKNKSSETETSKLKKYQSDSLHIAFSYPETWDVKTNGNKLGVFEPHEDSVDDFQENIMIWTEDMPIGISDSLFAKAAVAELKIKNPSLNVHVLPVKKLGENTFSAFVFDFSNADSTTFTINGYTMVKGKRGYNFSCTSRRAKAPAHQAKFESILSTVKPL